MDNILPFLILAVLAIMIQVAIIRYIFRIDTQIKNQNKMINLLSHMLKVNGVSDEEINKLNYKR